MSPLAGQTDGPMGSMRASNLGTCDRAREATKQGSDETRRRRIVGNDVGGRRPAGRARARF